MTAPSQLRPVTRLQVLVGGLVLLAVLGGSAALTDVLRHPPPAAPPPAVPDGPAEDEPCPPRPRSGPSSLVTSGDLYDCPHTYDGHTVTFEGEVVGAVLRRADGAWVQLNDDAYAGDLGPLPSHRAFRGGNSGVGVHIAPEVARELTWVGSHRSRGDVLTVTGVFHLSDPTSGESAVIRAAHGEVTRSGGSLEHPPLRDRQVAGVVLGLVAIAVLGAGVRRRGR